MLARTVPRVVARRAPRFRARGNHGHTADSHVVEGAPSAEWLAQQAAVEHHAAQTSELWRKLSFYVAFPTTFLVLLWVRKAENEHAEHEKHLREENGGELPPTPEYPYLNHRGRPFPWGMNTLFFNPHANKDMSDA